MWQLAWSNKLCLVEDLSLSPELLQTTLGSDTQNGSMGSCIEFCSKAKFLQDVGGVNGVPKGTLPSENIKVDASHTCLHPGNRSCLLHLVIPSKCWLVWGQNIANVLLSASTRTYYRDLSAMLIWWGFPMDCKLNANTFTRLGIPCNCRF